MSDNPGDVLQRFESALETGVNRGELLALVAKSVNIPKPLLAMAYVQLSKVSDDQLQEYAQITLQVVKKVQAGEPLGDALKALGLPAELEGVINSYAQKFNVKTND